ncbi:hypothetical protein D6777_00695 [Candidatus Woesearchaeota archaeon]|nr:MAG: hypothetical protein D6777_00695 [Candidatus Woesearchaeota archaeon]
MVNIDLISIIVFYGILLIFFFKNKKRFTIQSKVFALYKTKLGINLMDRIAQKFPRFMKVVGYFGTFVGFAGMIFIFFFLIKETLKFLYKPGAQPPLAPVLPGVHIPGAPTLSFWHWIIAIFIVAIVHEFSHGMLARTHKIKIKSSGFAFLGPILAAFVEPDEKQLNKKPLIQQLSVFAAGPFSNIVLGFLFLLILSNITAPIAASFYLPAGITVNGYLEGYPAEKSGVDLPFTILSINNKPTKDFIGFLNVTTKIKPGDEVYISTDKGNFSLVAAANPENKSRGFMGVTGFQQKKDVKEKYKGKEVWVKVFMWFNLLIMWLFLINIGVGLFNLLPLGPVDGGRMFMTTALAIFKDKRVALRIFAIVSWICLLLIFINLWPWIVKLFNWIVKIFILLIALI